MSAPRMITVLQAAAILVLWQSRRFDTHQIATVLGGGACRRLTFTICWLPRVSASTALTSAS